MSDNDQEHLALLLNETFKELEGSPDYKEFVPMCFDLISSRFEFATKDNCTAGD